MALRTVKLCEKLFTNLYLRANRSSLPRILDGYVVGGSNVRHVRTNIPKQVALPKVAVQETIQGENEEDAFVKTETFSNVNRQIKDNSHGRLFAVIQLMGKQFKVTNEDIIIVEGFWDPHPGDKIKMEKVLLVGASDFTVIGRPILPKSLVNVEGTVIEKALSHTKTHFVKRRRKQYQRINFYKSELTKIRINTVEFKGLVNERRDVEGTEGCIF